MTAEEKVAWEFLRSNRLATLATFSVEKQTPQSAWIYYMVDEEWRICFATTRGSRKIVNIGQCKKVALMVGDEDTLKEIQIEGEAEVIADLNKKSQVIAHIAKVANENLKSTNFPPLLKLSRDKGLECVKIIVKWFKYSDFEGKDKVIIEGTGQG